MTSDVVWQHGSVAAAERARLMGGPGVTVWLTGLSGSGKSTIAFIVERQLIGRGRAAYVLDGDNLRHGLNHDLGFTPADRTENVRRVGEVARLLADAGLVVLVPVIAPYRRDRARARRLHETSGVAFLEVFVDAPLDVCEGRDPKGLYRRARAGELEGFTGVGDPYEEPHRPDLRIDSHRSTAEESALVIVASLLDLPGTLHSA